MNINKATYFILRSITFLGGIVLLTLALLSLINPELLPKSSRLALQENNIQFIVVNFLFSIVYLIPYRFTIKGLAYKIRMGLVSLISFKMLYYIYGYLRFRQDSEYLFIEIGTCLIIGIIFPLSLYLKKRLAESGELVND